MTTTDPIGLWLAMSTASGLAAHMAIAAWRRRSYRRLRAAYVDAVSTALETGTADRLVRPRELDRLFMHATAPSWLAGLGSHLTVAFVLCTVAGVAVMIVAGRLPPVVVGIAGLFAIGLRRILVATALLLSLFAATSLISGPSARTAREHGSQLFTRSHSHPAPARLR